LGEESTPKLASGELSEPSISQGVEKSGKGEYAVFVGFYGCFLEIIRGAVADQFDILYSLLLACPSVVVLGKQAPRVTSGR
jgi:hypothetical protein